MREIREIVGRLLAGGRSAPAALATLVSVEGSSYRRAGARMLVEEGGRTAGSISGGCLEEDVRERAGTVARTGRPELVVYDTTSENDLLWGVGTGCHGVVRVLIEPVAPGAEWIRAVDENLRAGRPTALAVAWEAPDPALLGTRLAAGGPAPGTRVFSETLSPPPSLAVFGAGDDARPLVRAASGLAWRVTVADPRPAYATAERFPEAAVVVAGAEELVGRVAPGPGSLAVVMTHHYVHDVPILRGLLPLPLAYVGLLGPRRRAERILADLAAGGLAATAEMRRRLHAPVGLDLGAEGPEEVALSIVAEMSAVLAGTDARPLREGTGPIHG